MRGGSIADDMILVYPTRPVVKNSRFDVLPLIILTAVPFYPLFTPFAPNGSVRHSPENTSIAGPVM